MDNKWIEGSPSYTIFLLLIFCLSIKNRAGKPRNDLVSLPSCGLTATSSSQGFCIIYFELCPSNLSGLYPYVYLSVRPLADQSVSRRRFFFVSLLSLSVSLSFSPSLYFPSLSLIKGRPPLNLLPEFQFDKQTRSRLFAACSPACSLHVQNVI